MWVPEGSYAIAGIDLPRTGTHGWQVRLRQRGVKYGKFFADRLHGGIREAHKKAREWRDAIHRELSAVESAPRVCRSSPRNSSGGVGVSKIRVIAVNGAEYWFWLATWFPERGRRCCVKFPVKRHGDRQALRLAVEARREGTGCW